MWLAEVTRLSGHILTACSLLNSGDSWDQECSAVHTFNCTFSLRFFFSWLWWVFVAALGLSLAAAGVGSSFPSPGFSLPWFCCGEQAVGTQASVLAPPGY